jgi:5-methylcytosine-specific restriction protein A
MRLAASVASSSRGGSTEAGRHVSGTTHLHMKRNPPWARDELILALDLYFRVNPLHTTEKHPEIETLSKVLNGLPIHEERPDLAAFRNPNGVYMKLCNFLRFDPGYRGKGLTRGGREEQGVWDEFAGDLKRLRRTADSIRKGATSMSTTEVAAEVPSETEEFTEGRILTALHKRRERNPTLVRKKKDAARATSGKLECEVCGFDFEQRYGSLGAGFAECHHTVALSKLGTVTRTRLTDLVLVCSNCHRMLHRSRPMLSIQGLRTILQ